MKNDLIISLAVDGRDKYSENVKGLEQSIEKHWKGDVRIFKTFPDYVTPHSVVPYKFKFDLIKQAYLDGYRKVFWLDSTMRLNKDISELFARYNVIAFNNLGHLLYQYITDEAVNNLLTTELISNEDEIYTIPMCWGGAFGLNLNDDLAYHIFNFAAVHSLIGSFNDGISNREGFISSRHDQSCLSVILHNYGIPLLPYGVIAAPKDANENTYIIYGDN